MSSWMPSFNASPPLTPGTSSTMADARHRRRYEATLATDRQRKIETLRDDMMQAETYDQWMQAAVMLDALENRELWKVKDESPFYDHALVQMTVEHLREAHAHDDLHAISYHLRNSLHRNFAGLENVQLYEHTHVGTKHLVEDYVKQVLTCIDHLVQSKSPAMSIGQRLAFCREIRHLYGHTALLLSGGAMFGLYHLGVVKALAQAHLLPRLIAGSSAGALIACIIGVRTDDEVATLFETGASMKLDFFGESDNVLSKIRRLLREGVVLDIANVKRCCVELIGDVTFQEAYQRTGRTLNVTVSHATRLKKGTRLLNHLTAPRVVVWSAACASCAVPGLFKPVTILAKSHDGDLVPFEPTAQQYVDGSYLNDLPIDELSELFGCNYTIVSQVNPYVIPFVKGLQKQETAHPAEQTAIQSLCNKFSVFMKSEIHHRCLQAADLGLAPRILEFLVPVINQIYSGDVTIVPDLRNGFKDYMNVMSNPTESSIQDCIRCGQRSTWPALSMIVNHYSIERALLEAVDRMRYAAADRSYVDAPLGSRSLSDRNALVPRLDHDDFSGAGRLVALSIAGRHRPSLLADIAVHMSKMGLRMTGGQMTTQGDWAFYDFTARLHLPSDRDAAHAHVEGIAHVFQSLFAGSDAIVSLAAADDTDPASDPAAIKRVCLPGSSAATADDADTPPGAHDERTSLTRLIRAHLSGKSAPSALRRIQSASSMSQCDRPAA
ncbi:PNPLA domain-containing protein [Plasmodiophora brassicae]